MMRITDTHLTNEPLTDREWLEGLAADLEHRNAHNESLSDGDVAYVAARLRVIASMLGAQVSDSFSWAVCVDMPSPTASGSGQQPGDAIDATIVRDYQGPGDPTDATVAPILPTGADITPTAEEETFHGAQTSQGDVGDTHEDAADRASGDRRQDD